MARKVFQDFAHVLCQKFIEVPSNRDLVNLALFGDGTLELDIVALKARHSRFPIEPLPYADKARSWLAGRLIALDIPATELASAALTVRYSVVLARRPSLPIFPSAQFDFACTGIIEAPDRKYTSELRAQMEWSLGSV